MSENRMSKIWTYLKSTCSRVLYLVQRSRNFTATLDRWIIKIFFVLFKWSRRLGPKCPKTERLETRCDWSVQNLDKFRFQTLAVVTYSALNSFWNMSANKGRTAFRIILNQSYFRSEKTQFQLLLTGKAWICRKNVLNHWVGHLKTLIFQTLPSQWDGS